MLDYVLIYSLEKGKKINIRYKKDNKVTLRDIKVLKIQNDDIKAYCYLRHEIRSFKKGNILSAIMYNS